MLNETIVIDFDGVIHRYDTKWIDASVISDGPVDGAIEFLLTAIQNYQVAIFSARSHQKDGISAMQSWLRKNLTSWLNESNNLKEIIRRQQLSGYKDMTDNQLLDKENWAISIVNRISWPVTKIPAKVYIDDSGISFKGTWPSMTEIDNFKPWNK